MLAHSIHPLKQRRPYRARDGPLQGRPGLSELRVTWNFETHLGFWRAQVWSIDNFITLTAHSQASAPLCSKCSVLTLSARQNLRGRIAASNLPACTLRRFKADVPDTRNVTEIKRCILPPVDDVSASEEDQSAQREKCREFGQVWPQKPPPAKVLSAPDLATADTSNLVNGHKYFSLIYQIESRNPTRLPGPRVTVAIGSAGCKDSQRDFKMALPAHWTQSML